MKQIGLLLKFLLITLVVLQSFSTAFAGSDEPKMEITWKKDMNVSPSEFREAAYANKTYAVITAEDTIEVLQKDKEWQTVNVKGDTVLNSIASNGGRFVAVGNQGKVITSTDGIQWEYCDLKIDKSFKRIKWDGNRFWIFCETGYALTSLDGVKWSEFKVNNSIGSSIYTDWTIRDIAFNGKTYVALGNYGIVATSGNGSVWNIQEDSISGYFNMNSIVWGDGQFIAVGDQGMIAVSADGYSWVKKTSGTTWDIRNVAFGGGCFYAVTGAGLLTSSNGEKWDWTKGSYTNVVFTADQSIVVTGNDTLLTTVDGIRWDVKKYTSSYELKSVASNGRQFVAVGTEGMILNSENGIRWKGTKSIAPCDYRAIVWTGQKFVVIGDNLTILTSEDGVRWSEKKLHFDNIAEVRDWNENLNDIVWTGEQLVAVSGLGSILISNDGVEWKRTRAPTAFWQGFENVVWDGRKVVAFCNTSDTYFSSEDGIHWNEHKFDEDFDVEVAVWTGNQYICAGSVFTHMSGEWYNGVWKYIYKIKTSKDGIYWETKSYDESEKMNMIQSKPLQYDTNQLIAVGEAGTVAISADGLNWTGYDTGHTGDLNSIACNGDQYVAVGRSGTILLSEDGLKWSKIAYNRDNGYKELKYIGNKLFMLGDKSNISNLTDGITLEYLQGDLDSFMNDVAWNGNQFIVAGNGETLFKSVDGRKWTKVDSQTDIEIEKNYTIENGRSVSSRTAPGLYSVTWGKDKFVAVGQFGAVYVSADGDQWKAIKNPIDDNIYGIAYGNGKYAAVAYNESIITSEDGIHWSHAYSGTKNRYLYNVIWGKDQFIAVGDEGILSSKDGIKWTRAAIPISAYIKCITWTGEWYFAGGGEGTLLASRDGIKWIKVKSSVTKRIDSMVWDGKQILISSYDGSSGMIYSGNVRTVTPSPTPKPTSTPTPKLTVTPAPVGSNDTSISSDRYRVDQVKVTISIGAAHVPLVTFKANVKIAKGASYQVLKADGKTAVASGNVIPGMKVKVLAKDKKSSKTYTVIQ